MSKVETNILERLGVILGLSKDSEYIEAVDNFLDAASSQNEMEQAREILFNKLTAKINEPEISDVIRAQEHSDLLYTSINNLKNYPCTDEAFYNFAYLTEELTKSIAAKKIEETYTFDTKSITELAEKIDSEEALTALKEYDENNDIESLLNALKCISTTIKTGVFELDKEDRKSKKITKKLEKMDSALNEIRNTIYDENLAITGINIEKYANASESAYNTVKRKKNSKKGKSLFVKIGSALKKRKNYKLNRTPKKGKIVKGTIISALGILVVATTINYLIKTKDISDEYQPKNNVTTITTIDGKTILEIVVPTAKLNRIADKVLEEVQRQEEKNNEQNTSSNTVETTTSQDNSTTPTPVPTENPTAAPSIAPTSTPAPVTSEPEPNTNDLDATTIAELTNAANTVFNNWSIYGLYSYQEIYELVKVMNGYDSEISIQTADDMLVTIMNATVVPGANNAIAGEKIFETYKLDFASLLIKNQSGLSAVNSMQSYLNGLLTDSLDNIPIYAERTVTDEAIIMEMNGTTGGLGINSGDPAARLLWSRLAIASNAITGPLGADYSVTLDGKTYSQATLSDAIQYEQMATIAKQELQNQKTM